MQNHKRSAGGNGGLPDSKPIRPYISSHHSLSKNGDNADQVTSTTSLKRPLNEINSQQSGGLLKKAAGRSMAEHSWPVSELLKGGNNGGFHSKGGSNFKEPTHHHHPNHHHHLPNHHPNHHHLNHPNHHHPHHHHHHQHSHSAQVSPANSSSTSTSSSNCSPTKAGSNGATHLAAAAAAAAAAAQFFPESFLNSADLYSNPFLWQSLHSMAATGTGNSNGNPTGGSAANAFPTNLFNGLSTQASANSTTANPYHSFMSKFPQLYSNLYTDMSAYSQYLHLLKSYQTGSGQLTAVGHQMNAGALLTGNHFNAAAVAAAVAAASAASASATNAAAEKVEVVNMACSYCSEDHFESVESLESHVIVRHAQRKTTVHRCDACKASPIFDSQADVTLHFMEKHVRRLFECLSCKVPPFESKAKLDEHIVSRHGKDEPRFGCALCDADNKGNAEAEHQKTPTLWASEAELREHVQAVHPITPGTTSFTPNKLNCKTKLSSSPSSPLPSLEAGTAGVPASTTTTTTTTPTTRKVSNFGIDSLINKTEIAAVLEETDEEGENDEDEEEHLKMEVDEEEEEEEEEEENVEVEDDSEEEEGEENEDEDISVHDEDDGDEENRLLEKKDNRLSSAANGRRSRSASVTSAQHHPHPHHHHPHHQYHHNESHQCTVCEDQLLHLTVDQFLEHHRVHFPVATDGSSSHCIVCRQSLQSEAELAKHAELHCFTGSSSMSPSSLHSSSGSETDDSATSVCSSLEPSSPPPPAHSNKSSPRPQLSPKVADEPPVKSGNNNNSSSNSSSSSSSSSASASESSETFEDQSPKARASSTGGSSNGNALLSTLSSLEHQHQLIKAL